MSNNLVRNSAGVTTDTRRIKNHRAMITLGFGRAVSSFFFFSVSSSFSLTLSV